MVEELNQAASDALIEFGLRLETEAKKELRTGHGVVTGTLRRSIHTSGPSYNWEADNVAPGEGTPDRGGGRITPEREGNTLAIETGSGMEYAMAVHQGHGTFEGYHFLTLAFERIKDLFPGILERKAKARMK